MFDTGGTEVVYLLSNVLQKNWNLFSVNVAMATTGIYQLSRKIRYASALWIVVALFYAPSVISISCTCTRMNVVKLLWNTGEGNCHSKMNAICTFQVTILRAHTLSSRCRCVVVSFNFVWLAVKITWLSLKRQ